MNIIDWDKIEKIAKGKMEEDIDEGWVAYCNQEVIVKAILELKDRIDALEEQARYQQRMAFGSLRDI